MRVIHPPFALRPRIPLPRFAYSYQTFSVGQVLTAAQMQQVEDNIRDHAHGADGVATITEAGLGSFKPRIQLAESTLGSAAAQLDIAFDPTGYPIIEIDIEYLLPVTNTDTINIRMSQDGGSSFYAGSGYWYAMVGVQQAASVSINQNSSVTLGPIVIGGVSNSSVGGLNGRLRCAWFDSSTRRKSVDVSVTYFSSGNAFVKVVGSVWGEDATLRANPVDALRFLASTGNLAAGSTVRAFGSWY